MQTIYTHEFNYNQSEQKINIFSTHGVLIGFVKK